MPGDKDREREIEVPWLGSASGWGGGINNLSLLRALAGVPDGQLEGRLGELDMSGGAFIW